MDKFGAVSAEFCWEEDREQCCYTGRLDNPSKDDFEKGAVDDFSGFMIGNCDKFHVPYARVGHAKAIHMYWDGWKGEYFEITFQVHFLPFVCNVKYFYCAFFFSGRSCSHPMRGEDGEGSVQDRRRRHTASQVLEGAVIVENYMHFLENYHCLE